MLTPISWGTLGRVARMTAERLEEEIPQMSLQQLAISCGIATDKLQNLTGDVNLRIEHIVASPLKRISSTVCHAFTTI